MGWIVILVREDIVVLIMVMCLFMLKWYVLVGLVDMVIIIFLKRFVVCVIILMCFLWRGLNELG